MKNGKPSRIFDIRYFHPGTNVERRKMAALRGYGSRLAWCLNSRNLSLGSYNSLYLSLEPTMSPREIKLGEPQVGEFWWFRYVYTGLPEGFPDLPEAGMGATVAVLKFIKPDAEALIDEADRLVRHHGSELRLLLRSRDYSRYTLRAAVGITDWPAPSKLYFSLIERESGASVELPPIPTDGFRPRKESESVRISDFEITHGLDGKLTASWKDQPNACTGISRSLDGLCYTDLVRY